MAGVKICSVRVQKITKNGELIEKFSENCDLLCEYDPLGINIKLESGKNY